jgi:hypothetical protein
MIGVVPLELAARGSFDPLGSATVGFQLRHDSSLSPKASKLQ